MINIALAQSKDTVEVSEAAFGREFNEDLVHQVVVALRNGQRQGTKAQKDRSTVSYSTRKPWKQKGTGRARAGTAGSNIWRHGGRAFAASPRDYKQKINKKMYKGAMTSLMSEMIRQERVIVVKDIAVAEPRTKHLIAKLKELNLSRVLIVVKDSIDENLYLASRNIPDVDVVELRDVTPLKIMQFGTVLMTVDAVKKCEEMFV